MSTPYDYNVIGNLNMNIRVSRDIVLMDETGVETVREPDITYSQAVLSLSDVEDMLESANSVAENVVLYHKEDSQRPDLTEQQLRETRHIITDALSTLLDNLTNVEFLTTNVEQVNSSVNRYTHIDKTATHETTVSIMYKPDILSTVMVFPARPGAIVNNYEIKAV